MIVWRLKVLLIVINKADLKLLLWNRYSSSCLIWWSVMLETFKYVVTGSSLTRGTLIWMLICYLKILPCTQEDWMNLRGITDVESIKPGRPLSCSSGGLFINPGPVRRGGPAGGPAGGRGPGSTWPQAVQPALRFKCASHFHGAEHAQAAPPQLEEECCNPNSPP